MNFHLQDTYLIENGEKCTDRTYRSAEKSLDKNREKNSNNKNHYFRPIQKACEMMQFGF